MIRDVERPVTAVLGPTNTGKTHLAVERLCGHSSGMIGFPLRLLAREVYDRVVALKGPSRVALMTGEERIVPPDARWFLCTAESMPLDRDLAFVGLDEAQLGADPERGHVFTDRVLRARGREETMILGSEALRPMLKALVPGIDIIGRPRFSTLSYAGARKISRLPKRSAIVAFSAEEVYAVAEMLRRLRGGAAVVMGALSPRTRNAQVAMFQSGEVDYLVATDAIGMGLNLDVAHVAFASLAKFDGHRQRRLTVAEMAQIAGRAGRHQRDGSFGALVEQGPGASTPDEILAIEQHRFPALDFLYWRNGAPAFNDLDTLIAALEERPAARGLRAAPEATDLAVLKRLADEAWVRDRVRGSAMVARLWAAAGVPDFRKLGIDPHARFVGRLFGHLSEGNGHIPQGWFAEEIARLDNVQGDVETLAGRIAAARSWAYIAHRAHWLADPGQMAQRTRDLEQRLSDALHRGLTQRFVDRRTTMLMRQIGAGAAALPVVIADDGSVSVDDQVIGRIDGFAFSVAADARGTDRRLLLGSAERRLGGERNRRGRLLAAAGDDALALDHDPAGRVLIRWESAIGGTVVAGLAAGPTILCPRIVLDRTLNGLDRSVAAEIAGRLDRWLSAQIARALPVLEQLDGVRRDRQASSALRAVAAALIDAGAIASRAAIAAPVDALDPASRKALRTAGITIGALDLFDPRLLKSKAASLRRLLIAVRRGCPAGAPPPIGATVLDRDAPGATLGDGFRPLGSQAVRVDLVERIARAVHEARPGREPFVPDPALATSIGLRPDTIARVMAALGFRLFPGSAGGDVGADAVAAAPHWVWRGLDRPVPVAPAVENAFAALAALGVRYA